MNIIFLDMDGVLNCNKVQEDWIKQYGHTKEAIDAFKKKYCLNQKPPYYFIVPELLERFNTLYSKIPNCKIVWSSSWRNTVMKKSKLFIEGLYYQCGLPKDSFIGYTPYIPYLLRYNEIEEWIKDHIDKFEIEKCAIIDDMYEASISGNKFLNIPIKFFQTSEKYGLTEEISKNILTFFMEKNNND